MAQCNCKSFLLLLAAIAMGITIYAACSLDDDDFGASQSELESNADGVLDLSNEHQGTVFFTGNLIPARIATYNSICTFPEWGASLIIEWDSGYTGNIILPHSDIYITVDPFPDDFWLVLPSLGGINEDKFKYKLHDITATGTWNPDNNMNVRYRYICDEYRMKCNETDYHIISSTVEYLDSVFEYNDLLDHTFINDEIH